MMRPIAVGFVFAVLASFVSCSQYAEIHIRTVNAADESIPLEAFSGRSGLFLGTTPLTLRLTRVTPGPRPLVNVVVRDGCRIVGWEIVDVERWANTPARAADAAFANTLRVSVAPGGDCTTSPAQPATGVQ
jgi:hypothetical protein